MKKLKHKLISVSMAWLCLAGPALAEDWGNITGTFTYGGDVPEASKLNITKDLAVCGKHNLVNEDLVVNADNKGIANVVVFMYLKKSDKAPPIHESYNESDNAEVTFDNLNCEFTPRVGLLRTSQTLLIGNKDPVGHNTKISCSKNTEFNPIVAADTTLKKQFPEVERLPVPVSCSIHPWMKGWLLIKDNPYFAVTDEDGKFEIKMVPAGEWTFQVWHEKSGYVQDVTKDGSKENWKKGRVEIKVDAGGADLGVCEIAAAAFEG